MNFVIDQTDSDEYSEEQEEKLLHCQPERVSVKNDEPIINIFSFMGKQIDQNEVSNEAEKTLSHVEQIQVIIREEPRKIEQKQEQQHNNQQRNTIDLTVQEQRELLPAKRAAQKSLTAADLVAQATCPDTNFTISEDYEAIIVTNKRQKKREKAIQKQKDIERRLNKKRRQELQTVFNGVLSYF